MSHGTSVSRGAGVGLAQVVTVLHLHLSFITLICVATISLCAVAQTVHMVAADLSSQFASAGRAPSLCSSPRWQGRQIPPAREHQSHRRARVYLNRSRVGWLPPLRLPIATKSKASWNFHPLFLNSKPDFCSSSVAEIKVGAVGSSWELTCLWPLNSQFCSPTAFCTHCFSVKDVTVGSPIIAPSLADISHPFWVPRTPALILLAQTPALALVCQKIKLHGGPADSSETWPQPSRPHLPAVTQCGARHSPAFDPLSLSLLFPACSLLGSAAWRGLLSLENRSSAVCCWCLPWQLSLAMADGLASLLRSRPALWLCVAPADFGCIRVLPGFPLAEHLRNPKAGAWRWRSGGCCSGGGGQQCSGRCCWHVPFASGRGVKRHLSVRPVFAKWFDTTWQVEL